MLKAEMTSSNHTTPTVAETIDDTRTIDIDMDILKKDRVRDISDGTDTTRSLSEKWTGLNDSCNIKIENQGDDTENSGSVTSEPRRQFSRRNSNESACSRGSQRSTGSSGSKSSAKRKTATKRRSWKKPKDKPKRPLSAYNIFFKHTRSRIVEGLSEEGTTEETIASIEGIVANSTETRRHRKTHGQISFGDLARTIADKWKTIDKNQRALFDHYAALDMKRYRRDVSIWKAKKEQEAIAASGGGEGGARALQNLEVSGSSQCSLNYLTDSQTTIGVGENYDDWNTPQNRALSASFNSVESEDDFGLQPLPIADLHESQNGMRGVPSYIDGNPMQMQNNMMAPDNNLSMNSGYGNDPNNQNGNNSLQNKKLRDIWMKNRQLEESINKLKQELSATNFSLGSDNANTNNNNPNDLSANHNSKFMNPPYVGGPSIDRMQQLHRRRLLMGDILPPMQQQQQHEEALAMESAMQMEPAFDMNPVPFEEVFNATGAEANMKKKELITNLNHLDFFGNGGGGGNC